MLPVLMGLEGPELSSEEANLISRQQPAGFVLFSRNIVSAQQTRALTDSLRQLCVDEPIIAIDQEGGRVVRTSALGLELPSASALSHSNDATALIVESARLIAQSLRMLGINLDLAPVLDIEYDKERANALSSRCWGTAPGEIIERAGLFAYNLKANRMGACGKHFPGMGRALNDPHQDLPVITTPSEEHMVTDLAPFTAMAPDLPAIMTAHILLPGFDTTLPATLSPRIIKGILRDRLGYEGLVLTDDLCMGAICNMFGIAHATHLAWQAGCDLPLICHQALPVIEELVKAPDPRSDYNRADSERRIAKFQKAHSSHLAYSSQEWSALISRSKALLAKVTETGNTPYSVVQAY